MNIHHRRLPSNVTAKPIAGDDLIRGLLWASPTRVGEGPAVTRYGARRRRMHALALHSR
jgi:hypothetical protein